MRKALLLASVFAAASAHAQSWSVGAGAGPFIFGRFVERSVTLHNETGSATTQTRLSAETRAGVEADVERDLGSRFALRLEATWVQSPLRIKSKSGDQGTSIDAGHMNTTALVLPLVIRINPNGAFRFHVMGGPAYAFYNVHRRAAGGGSLSFFEGTRAQWGGAGAVGAEWWWNRQLAVEWQAEAIVTSSPFRADDFGVAAQGIHIPKPRNGHTTIGIRYRF
jgi:outer membrane protein with beta-barrel domain